MVLGSTGSRPKPQPLPEEKGSALMRYEMSPYKHCREAEVKGKIECPKRPHRESY